MVTTLTLRMSKYYRFDWELDMEHVTIGNCTLYLGDCDAILPQPGKIDAVVSDPPYGMGWNTDTTRFSSGKHGTKGKGVKNKKIINDNKPFNPTPWLVYPKVVLFGSNHFAQRLPVGTTLVWIKKYDKSFGTFLSDAETAWMKGGHGVFCKRVIPVNFKGKYHPTLKPVELMKWCLVKAKIQKTDIVLDPYMGSGSTGVACIEYGCKFIGIEIDKKYFDIACKRIKHAYINKPRLFDCIKTNKEQLSLF